MVAESEADNRSEQEAREEHVNSPERWTLEVGRGCPDLTGSIQILGKKVRGLMQWRWDCLYDNVYDMYAMI